MSKLALLALVPWLLGSSQEDDGFTAFVDVNVVTMEREEVLPHRTVLIREGRIVAIAPVGELDVPIGAERIDGHDAYLMPGLADLHVHLQDDIDPELYVLNGVTTVRECSGTSSAFDRRARYESGEVLGPRLRIATEPIIGFGHGLEGAALDAAAHDLIRGYADRGYEFLKIYGDITAEGYMALVGIARDLGMRPIGHTPRNLRLDDVLAMPPDSIAHAEEFLYTQFLPELDESTIPDVARKVADAGVSVVTTLTTYDHIGRQVADLAQEFDRGETRYASALQLRDWAPDRNRHKHFAQDTAPSFRHGLEFQKKFLGAFHEAGVPLLLGTDSGGNGIPFVFAGFSAHEELVHLTECGLSNFEALAAGTIAVARYLGEERHSGTVAVGKRADLILCWGNPLEDVRNASLRAGVMVRGRWIPSEEIRARLDRIAELGRREAEFVRAVTESGPEAGREVLERSLGSSPSMLPFRQRTLNELGYEALLIDGDVERAVALFELNVEVHPDSWVAFDSLGEALAAAGDLPSAIECYTRSVELYPGNLEGAETLAELRAAD